MPDLHRLDIRTHGNAPAVMLILAQSLAAGWEEQDLPEGGTLFRAHAERKDFLENLREEIQAAVTDAEFEFEVIEEQDWMNSWRDFFTPVQCGSRFVVLPPWLADEDYGKLAKIIIDPASAFGTGHHESTCLCLGALSGLLDDGILSKGQTFLDLGCGSGVLGLAACLSGLVGLGVDTDILAMENARKNRELNKVDRLDLACGSLEKAQPLSCDLVMANILAGPLIEMAKDISDRLRPGGQLILSGILDRQADEVSEAYMAVGLHPVKTLKQDEWRMLLFEKP